MIKSIWKRKKLKIDILMDLCILISCMVASRVCKLSLVELAMVRIVSKQVGVKIGSASLKSWSIIKKYK